ncbi:MAG: hypothetical protein LLG04_02655 [Parachlamydia sp.]|nr:hypothetical protein [Parachlamydia sp.]
MTFRSNKDLKTLLHPYLFALKEGPTIQKDFLDYSLLMLQVTSPEIIRSPDRSKRPAEFFLPQPISSPREAGNPID